MQILRRKTRITISIPEKLTFKQEILPGIPVIINLIINVSLSIHLIIPNQNLNKFSLSKLTDNSISHMQIVGF
jgi:hypothetical protein